jgi:hypothetical protein
MNRPTCETCPYFATPAELRQQLAGQCRRHANEFPNRHPDSWCGEHPMFFSWQMSDPVFLEQQKSLVELAHKMVSEKTIL